MNVDLGTRARLTAGLSAVMASAMMLLPAPLSAQIVETSTIKNSLSYTFGANGVRIDDLGPTASIHAGVYDRAYTSEMSINLTSYLDNGNFYFLHDGYCLGFCGVTLTTEILFTVTNNGPTPVDLRFDSVITPGHLGRANFPGPGLAAGSFLFEVTQDPGTTNNQLYRATGNVGNAQLALDYSGDPSFNGLDYQDKEPAFSVLDWSATNLNLNLTTLDAGASTIVRYFSRMTIITQTYNCQDPTKCAGFQIAFGDPRNSGGVTNLQPAGLSLDGVTLDAKAVKIPAVGAPYDVYSSKYQFVPADSPLPEDPEVYPPIPYNIPYIPFGEPQGVPEPASWMMMLLGSAAIGGALRRRRAMAALVRA